MYSIRYFLTQDETKTANIKFEHAQIQQKSLLNYIYILNIPKNISSRKEGVNCLN